MYECDPGLYLCKKGHWVFYPGCMGDNNGSGGAGGVSTTTSSSSPATGVGGAPLDAGTDAHEDEG